MKVNGRCLNLISLDSQAEGCEFKSRFPLQQNQAFTVKNAVKAFYFCDQIATCGRKKSCPSSSHSLPGHHIFPLQTPFSHALGMARGVFLFLLHRMSHGQTMPIEASASYGRNLVAISFFHEFLGRIRETPRSTGLQPCCARRAWGICVFSADCGVVVGGAHGLTSQPPVNHLRQRNGLRKTKA